MMMMRERDRLGLGLGVEESFFSGTGKDDPPTSTMMGRLLSI